MPEPSDNHHRRAGDVHDSNQNHILQILMEIQEEQRRQAQAHSNVADAFVKDDLNKPDFHGHRKAHIEMIKDAAVVDTYKQDATKKIIGIVVVFMVGVMATGLLDAIRK